MRNIALRACLSLSLIIVLFSCRKNSDRPTPGSPPAKTVKQISASLSDFVSYEYDSLGRVTRHTSQWQNGTGSLNKITNVYEYSSKNLVKTFNEGGYGLYSYSNNVLDKSEHFTNSGKKISSMKYSFSAGKLMEIIEQIPNALPDDPKETRISYQYYADGNVSRIDFAYRKELIDPFTINFSKVFVEYDKNLNPEPDGVIGFLLPGVVLMVNNPVRIDNLLPNGVVDGYSRFEYTYAVNGLPVQRKHFIAINRIEHPPITFQYSY